MWEALVTGFMDPTLRLSPWTIVVPLGLVGLSFAAAFSPLGTRALLLFLDPSSRAEGPGGVRRTSRVLRRLAGWGIALTVDAALLLVVAAYDEAAQRLPATGTLWRNAMERDATRTLFTAALLVGASIAVLAMVDLRHARDWFTERRHGRS